MREMKSKGKRTDNGEWVYGHYIKYIDLHVKIYIPKITDVIEEKHGIFIGKGVAEVDIDTVCHYTGLNDVENEIEVFGDDIVKIHQFMFDGNEIETEVIGLIEYSDELACWCISHINDLQMCRHMGYESIEEAKDELIPICSLYGLHEMSFTVIGNIHDNPELLK